jgi:hypothetical protein
LEKEKLKKIEGVDKNEILREKNPKETNTMTNRNV